MASILLPLAGLILLATWVVGLAISPDFEWGTIGDSWDSGVAYSNEVAYDDNAQNCLRLKDAYGAQMEADTTWTTRKQKFYFKGCSGARLGNMVKDDGQIHQTGSPEVIVMTAGGNNAGFGQIVDNCIYHGVPLGGYGPPFHDDPQGVGKCKVSLGEARQYINDPNGLGRDFKLTLDDIFNTDQVRSRAEFWLYVTGYAHFFNVDTDYCNNWSFSPITAGFNKPRVTKELRVVFNDLLEQFNNVYRNVIANYQPPPNAHIRYVSTTEGFGGHRFCEVGHTFNDQWYSPEVFVWNLQYNDRQGQQMTDKATTWMELPADASLDGFANALSGSGGNEIRWGWLRRPFHPKARGFTVIKDAVIAAMRMDRVPGVVLGYMNAFPNGQPGPAPAQPSGNYLNAFPNGQPGPAKTGAPPKL